jgi:Flp pilus assembly protein TadG
MRVKRKRIKSNRDGTAAVEFALVMPLFVAVIIGAVELCNMNVSKAMVINSARESARLAINANADESTINQITVSKLAEMLKVPQNKVVCEIKAVGPNGHFRQSFSQAQKGDLVNVTVRVPYNHLSIFAGSMLSSSTQVKDTCTMQKE